MTRWYRAYTGTVTDDKIAEVAMIAECSRSVAIATWHAILESCASAQDGGRYDTTPRRVAAALGESAKAIEAVFAGFTELGMIEGGRVTAWQRRQFESDNSTERSRKSRERQRSGDATACNGGATLQGRCATPPDTEAETDTEPEKIIEFKKTPLPPLPAPAPTFPRDGSIEFGPFAVIVRKHAPGRDVDAVASAFRQWASGLDPPLSLECSDIARKFSGFCQTYHRKRGARA